MKLRNLFVDDVPAAPTAPAAPPKPVKSAAIFPSAQILPDKPWGRPPAVDTDMVGNIRSKLDEASSDGYKKLMKILDGLTTIIPDEKMRFQSALVTMQNMGFDNNTAVQLFNQRVTWLENYSADFEKVVTQKISTLNGDSTKAISDLDATCKRLEAEIQERVGQLTDAKEAREKAATEQAEQTQSINSKALSARDAMRVLMDELTTARDRATTLLK